MEKPGILHNLKSELPKYLARARDTSDNVVPLDWWQRNSVDLPHWSAAARLVVLVQPSSISAEWVFSLLNNSFSDQQESGLQDYIEISLMLQLNN